MGDVRLGVRRRGFGCQVVPIVLGEFDETDVIRPGGVLDVIVDFGAPAAVGVAHLVIDDQQAHSDALGHGIQAVVDGGTGWECASLHSDDSLIPRTRSSSAAC
jgi:hypothetical protein